MKRNWQLGFWMVLAVILYFPAFSVEQSAHSVANHWMRNGLVALSIICLMLFFHRLPWIMKKSLKQKLRWFFFSITLLWLVLGALILRTSKLGLFDDELLQNPLTISLQPFWILVLFLTLILAASTLTFLRELIFVQQKRLTSRNYLFLIAALTFYVLIGISEPAKASLNNWFYSGSSFYHYLAVIFLLLMAFIHGFRCKWIHYLNRNQKVVAFFLGSMTFAMAFPRCLEASPLLFGYSTLVSVFFHAFFMFYIIYLSMALLGILFQLPSAGLMDKRIRELNILKQMSSTIGTIFDRDSLIPEITELSQKVVGANSTWIELRDGTRFVLAGTRGIRKTMIDQIPDEIFFYLHDCLEKEETLLINDVNRDANLGELKHWPVRIGSLLAAGITFNNQRLGILYAMTNQTFGFMEESRDLFKAVADQVAVALQNVNLVKVIVEQRVYKEELRVAHDAQMRILPQTMPKVTGLDVEGFCKTANEIGGDFFDVVKVSDDRLDFYVGDVSGKGASAAFTMAELKGAIRGFSAYNDSPKELLIQVNDFARDNFEPDKFTTMIYGIFIPSLMQLRIARAGHPPAYLLREEELVAIQTSGIGLGLSAHQLFEETLKEESLTLKKDDILVLYTDGIEEARDPEDNEFGDETFRELLRGVSHLSSKEIINEIDDRLIAFSKDAHQHDDMTLLVLRWVESSSDGHPEMR